MATDIKCMRFGSVNYMTTFLSDRNIMSTDVLSIIGVGNEIVVFYKDTLDTAPPWLAVTAPSSVRAGFVEIRMQKHPYVQLATVDDSPNSGIRVWVKRPTWPPVVYNRAKVVHREPDLWVAVIDHDMAQPPSFQFYIEAEDLEGNVWTFGSQWFPHSVTVVP